MSSDSFQKLLGGGGVVFINLDRRADRRVEVESEILKLGLIGIPVIRLSASDDKVCPARGCSASHIRALKLALEMKWEKVLVLEDDFMARKDLVMTEFDAQLDEIERKWLPWDVLLLSGNNFPPTQILSKNVLKVSNCQTTASYIVRSKYIPKLIACIDVGWKTLEENPSQASVSVNSIDQKWKDLQKHDTWLLLNPPMGLQRDSYSDIEKRDVSYATIMLQNFK